MPLKKLRGTLSSGEGLKNPSGSNWKKRRFHWAGGRRRGRMIVPLLLVVCVLVLALVAADYWMNYGKIYPGVSVGGVSLGGKTPEEAQRILQERTGGLEEIVLTGPEKFTLSSEQLDVGLDVRSSADRAYAVGRQGNILERASDRIRATWGTIPIPLAVDYDRERLWDGLSGVFLALRVETVEAGFEVNGNEVSVTESRTGQEVDEEKLLNDIEAGHPKRERDDELSVGSH